VIGLDSNVVVRYLAQDDARQARLATQLIEHELSHREPGYLSLPALAEVVWVMVRCYKADRAMVARVVERLLSVPQIRVQATEEVREALRAYDAGKVDFSDALIAALGLRAGCTHTATFDLAAGREPGFALVK
jgi:predicted nucleic-acid-binding protein